MNTSRNNTSPQRTTSPFRLLILGGGAVVTECHLPALNALGWLRSCTVVEQIAANAEKVHRRFPGLSVANESYDTFLSHHAVQTLFDAAVISLPNTLHAEATRRCLEAGLHVLCEKPLALTASECESLGSVARRTGRLLVVGMVRRWLPSIAAMRRALVVRLIGDVTAVELEDGGKFTWPSDTETVFQGDQGGVLLNMGVHFLDILQWSLGELQPVSYSDDYSGGIEVNCAFEMRTKAGAPVCLNLSWTHTLKNVFRIIGTRGTLTVSKNVFDVCRWESSDGALHGELGVEGPFQSGYWLPTFEACFVEQFWHFALAAKAPQESYDLVTAPDAACSQRLIDWAYAHRARKQASWAFSSVGRPGLDPGCVVVTGGTGFVGSHLVARLAGLRMTGITVPVRSFRSGAEVARYPVKMKRIDLLSEASCRNSVRDARYVFHLAYGTNGTDSRQITIEGTRNMIRAAIAEHVECIVIFGTCTVYGHPETSRPVDESFPLDPTLGDYGSSKAQMHRECLKLAQQASSTRVVLIVPGSVIGPGGGLFCAMPCEMASKGTFCWIDGGRGIANYTYVANLVDAAILAAREPSAHGQDFIIVDGHCSWKELLGPLVEQCNAGIRDMTADEFARLKKQAAKSGTLKDVLRSVLDEPSVMAAISNHRVLGPGKEWFVRSFPGLYGSVQALRSATDLINPPSAAPAAAPADWLDIIFGNWNVRFTSAKAQKYLGWRPLVSLKDAQRISIAWLEERGFHHGSGPDGDPGTVKAGDIVPFTGDHHVKGINESGKVISK